MKLYYLFLAAVLVLVGCSRHSIEEQEGQGGRLPGNQGEESAPAVTVPYFADGNPERVMAGGDGAADVVLTLARDNYLEAGQTTATVRSDKGATATAVFAAHKGLAEVQFRIAETTAFSIDGAAVGAPGRQSWRVERVKADQGATSTDAEGYYLVGDRAVRVAVVMKQSGNTVHIAVSGDELERDLTLDGDDLRADGTALYNNVKNTARPDEGFYAVLADDGEAEYLLLDGYDTGYGDPEQWSFVDGWIVGHVAFESYLVNPENAPWTVWVQRGDSCLRVLDLYHGRSLTARYNMASPGSSVIIKLDENRAVVERQPAGFAHPDIFNYTLEIAGEGVYDGKGEIFIRDPQYSDIDGNMDGWATRQASKLSQKSEGGGQK